MRRTIRRVVSHLTVLVLGAALGAHAQDLPGKLSDKAFWKLVNDLSEPTGVFPSENFTSNEAGYQWVLPELLTTTRRGDAYIGVGPEQNFTYIASARPKIAFILDIRSQALLQQLLYKALFEMADNRADFVSLLFSRPKPRGLNDAASPIALMAAFDTVKADTTLFYNTLDQVIERLVRKHEFGLDEEGIDGIGHVFEVFRDAGLRINYGSRAKDDLSRSSQTQFLLGAFTSFTHIFRDGTWRDSVVQRLIASSGERTDTTYTVNGRAAVATSPVYRPAGPPGIVKPLPFLDGPLFVRPVGAIDFATLMVQVDSQGREQSFLASEAHYRTVRDMQRRNLIVPVIGDFAGPKALRGIGAYLRENHANIGVFYTSNVEQYLFTNNVWRAFYENVATLPIDNTSTFIRSFFGSGFRPIATRGGARVTTATSRMIQVVDAFQIGTLKSYANLMELSHQ